MTKRIHAKHKIDRRLGENIWGRPKSPYNKREYGPGEHGQRRRGKLSDYGQQLRAKQKLKGYYGNITEKQFKAIYGEAARLTRRHIRESDRPARAPARCHRLSRQVRADGVRRPAVREPRPCAGQRPTRQHPELSLPRGRRGRGARQGQGCGLVLEAAQSPERDVPEYIEVDHTKMTAKLAALADAVRRALSGDDGAEPRHRVLLALILSSRRGPPALSHP